MSICSFCFMLQIQQVILLFILRHASAVCVKGPAFELLVMKLARSETYIFAQKAKFPMRFHSCLTAKVKNISTDVLIFNLCYIDSFLFFPPERTDKDINFFISQKNLYVKSLCLRLALVHLPRHVIYPASSELCMVHSSLPCVVESSPLLSPCIAYSKGPVRSSSCRRAWGETCRPHRGKPGTPRRA